MSKISDELRRHFEKTNSILKSATASAAGWDATVHNQSELSGKQVFLYVWDQPTDWLWMTSVSVMQFHKVTEQSSRDQKLKESIVGSLGHLIALCAAGRFPEKHNGQTWEDQLGLMASIYAGTTRTYEHLDRLVDGGHFLVLNYHKPLGINPKSDFTCSLRPAGAISGTNEPLTVEDTVAKIQQVLAIDQERHPEWFV